MIDEDQSEPNPDFEHRIRSAYQIPDPEQLFIDRLKSKLEDRFKDIGQSTEGGRSQWLGKSKLLLSPIAWGAIAIILVFFLIWGIRTLIPKVQPIQSIQSSPAPSIAPTSIPTQSEGDEGIITLPTVAGMPVPRPEEVITPSNASQITLLAHWGVETISAVDWAPDGNSFAVASANIIHIYDTATLEEINAIDNGSSSYQIDYSPDGRMLASSFNDSSVKIWEVASGSELRTLTGFENFVTRIAFSPNGEILATASYESPLKFWDVNTGQELHTLSGASTANFAFSPDGTLLATTGSGKWVRLWDVASGQELRQFVGHTDYLFGVAFSPDGTMLASTSNDLTIKLWEVATGNELKTFSDQAIPTGVAFLPDGTTLISIAGDGAIKLWNITSGQLLRTLGDNLQNSNILLSPDGTMVLYYSMWQGDAIKLLDIASGDELRRLDWQTYMVTSVAYSLDGRTIAIGLDSGGIKLLDAVNGQVLRSLSGHTKEAGFVKEVSSLAFSPDGAMLVSGSMDTTTRLWDLASGEQLEMMDGVNEFGWAGGIASVDFSPDGKFLAFAGPSGQVKVWDVVNHQEFRTLGGQEDNPSADAVASVAFSPDGNILAAGYASASIALWDLNSGQVLRTLPYTSSQWLTGVSELEFSPDGKILAAGYGDANIILWDVASGSQIHSHSFSWQDEITDLDFSPDGNILALGSGMGSMALLDTTSGTVLITLANAANGLAFSPDGKVLVSGAYDGVVRLWGMLPPNAIQQEPTSVLPSEEVSPAQEPAPAVIPEELDIVKEPIPVLLTGENIQPGDWSPDGSYFYYSQQGPTGEPGPDQAVVTLRFLDADTGEVCEGVKETIKIDPDWGYPEGVAMYERARWLDGSRLLYLDPSGELLAITPCSDTSENWTAFLPDVLTSLTYSQKADGSQMVLKGEQAYWLFTPSTHQSVKLDIPLPSEGMMTSIGWVPGEGKLYSSRIEERGGLWIIIETIDPNTGAASPVYEVQASEQLYGMEPKSASVDWIDKDRMLVYDTITGDQLIDLSSQPIQATNLFPDLFGIEEPPMESVMAWGVMWGAGGQDYHLILQTGMPADEQYYIYHPESGVVDQYPLDPPLFVVFPSGEGGIVQSYENPPSNNILRVIQVDSGIEPYDLVVKGPTMGQIFSLFATLLPGGQEVMFSSIQGVSIQDLQSGEITHFWGLDNPDEYQYFSAIPSPDGKTIVGYALQKSKEPGVESRTQTLYWLRLEP